MLRRIQSCPANLCSMVHRKKERVLVLPKSIEEVLELVKSPEEIEVAKADELFVGSLTPSPSPSPSPNKTEGANKVFHVDFIRGKTSRVFKRGDAVDEIVISSLNDHHISDPSQQLFLLLILKKILSANTNNLKSTLYEICLRAAISLFTHKIMEQLLVYTHLHAQFIHY